MITMKRQHVGLTFIVFIQSVIVTNTSCCQWVAAVQATAPTPAHVRAAASYDTLRPLASSR